MTSTFLVVCDSPTRRQWLQAEFMREDGLPKEQIDTLYIHDYEAAVYLGPFETTVHPGDEPAIRLDSHDGTATLITEEEIEEVPGSAQTTGCLSSGDARFFKQAFKFQGQEVEFDSDGALPDEEVKIEAEEDGSSPNEATDPTPFDLQTVIAEELNVTGLDLSDDVLTEGQVIENLVIRDCDLSSIEMPDAEFSNVDFRGTSFRDARLKGVTFDNCRLAGVDFTEAKLHEANFNRVSLTPCTFSGTNLEGADLRNLALERVDFSETYLNDAKFDGTNPERAQFDRAEMEDVSVHGTTFEHSSFVNADFKQTDDLADATFTDCDMRDVDLPRADLSSTTLIDTRFDDSDLRGANFSDSSYSGLEFTGANLEGAFFDEATVKSARFVDANLSGAQFERARLDGAVFNGAKADKAIFTEANLERSSFSQANLSGAKFEGAALYGCLLESSRIDDATTFDEECIYLREGASAPPGVNIGERQHEQAVSVYRTLESVHESNAFSSRARDYHRRRRLSQRRVAYFEGRFGDGIINLASSLFVSYGLQFRRLVGWSLLTIIGAALLYATDGLLVHEEFGRITFGMEGLSTGEVLLQTLLFSLLSFTGLGYGSFNPDGWGEWLSVTQAGLGVLVFSMFIYIFTTRAAR